MMYAVTVTILTHDASGDWHGSKSVPTFYLDSRVQGIVSAEHAAAVARLIVNPLSLIPMASIDVCAYPVGESEAESMAVARRAHEALGQEHAVWCAGPFVHLA